MVAGQPDKADALICLSLRVPKATTVSCPWLPVEAGAVFLYSLYRMGIRDTALEAIRDMAKKGLEAYTAVKQIEAVSSIALNTEAKCNEALAKALNYALDRSLERQRPALPDAREDDDGDDD
jgi:hypothetical protein